MDVVLVKSGKLSIGKAEKPHPGAGQILIRNKAFSVNPLDLSQRDGHYPPPPKTSEILGVDCAGTIEEVGAHVSRFKKGDSVMALLGGGGYAEYVLAQEELTMPIPKTLSFEEATAIPEVFLTAYQALFLIGEVQPHQKVLVHAGAGGVGTAAIQLIKEAGARAYVTCGTLEKIEACLSLGAFAGFNYKAAPFAPELLKITENHGVDLILDFIGASFWEQNFEVLAQGGAIIQLSTLGGAQIPHLDLNKLMRKWATLTGTGLRYRPLDYKARLVREFSAFALSRFERKQLRPVIDQVLPWKQIQKAHDLIESRKVIGKVVLSII